MTVHSGVYLVLYYAVQLYLETCFACTQLSVHLCCTLCILPRGQNWFYHIGQSVGGMLAPVLPRPGVATLRCCHLSFLCFLSAGFVSAPLTARDHWSEEDVEKGLGRRT